MNGLLRFLLAAVVSASPIDVALGQVGPSLADSIRMLEHARAQALLHADTAALAQIIAPEFTEVSRRGAVRTREDNLRDLVTNAMRYTAIAFDSLDVDIYGDIAILRGIASSSGIRNSVLFTERVRYTRIFARRDGHWQAVAAQSTFIQ